MTIARLFVYHFRFSGRNFRFFCQSPVSFFSFRAFERPTDCTGVSPKLVGLVTRYHLLLALRFRLGLFEAGRQLRLLRSTRCAYYVDVPCSLFPSHISSFFQQSRRAIPRLGRQLRTKSNQDKIGIARFTTCT
jgi:hypothetical protein